MNGLPEKTLISLIYMAKNDHKSITKEVRRNLTLIEEARLEGIYWVQIAEALGFPGKFREVQAAWAKAKKMGKKNQQRSGSGVRIAESETEQEPQANTLKTKNGKQEKVTQTKAPVDSKPTATNDIDIDVRRAAIRANLDRRAREMAVAGPDHEAGTFVLKPDTTN